VNPWLQVDPGVFDGQGFFFAALTKPSQGLQNDPVLVEQSQVLGQEVAVGMLAGQEFIAWQNLPPGHVVRFGEKAFFLHEQAQKLPGSLRWQGFELGRMVGNALRLKTRLRGLLPDFTSELGVNIEEIRDLEALLQGRSLLLPSGMDHAVRAMGAVGLYWRGLPLGWLTVKKGRCLWSPR
jgi:16S rRNA (cytosine1407-C5)-methyltransferase